MLSLGSAPHAQALAVGLQLPAAPLAPVVNAVNNVTSNLPVPVSMQSTPATVSASVDPSLPIVSSPAAPAAAPIQVNVPLPVTPSEIIPAIVNAAPVNSVSSAQPATAQTAAASSTTRSNSDSGATTASHTSTQIASTPTVVTSVRSAIQSAPLLGISGFMNSVPAALQNLARGLAGNPVDNFAYIIMSDFLFAMLVLSAGLAGMRYQADRSAD